MLITAGLLMDCKTAYGSEYVCFMVSYPRRSNIELVVRITLSFRPEANKYISGGRSIGVIKPVPRLEYGSAVCSGSRRAIPPHRISSQIYSTFIPVFPLSPKMSH